MTAEAENPSCRDERSTAPYNADKVSTPEMLEHLQKKHPDFKGDWSQLHVSTRPQTVNTACQARSATSPNPLKAKALTHARTRVQVLSEPADGRYRT